MNYSLILNQLYSNYYLSDNPSCAMSVLWKERAIENKVIKEGNNFKLSGIGFGLFYKRSLSNYLKNIPEIYIGNTLLAKYSADKRLVKLGKEICKKTNRIVSFDCVRQILSASLLLRYLKPKTIVIIGDGYGFMTSLLKMACPEADVICVNLGKILFFDAYYTQMALPDSKITFLEAEKYQSLRSLPVDLFINMLSMQEMTMDTIKGYFDIMRSSTVESYFYCCNRVEKEGIKFFDYPWHPKDKIIVDELCPWNQRYPINTYPFWRSFNGKIWHRLIKLSR